MRAGHSLTREAQADLRRAREPVSTLAEASSMTRVLRLMQKGPTSRWGPSKYYLPALAKNQPAKVGVASTATAGAGATAGAAVAGAAVAGAAAAAFGASVVAGGL